jgi:HD-GYP domain-containing protein (c-di-GMP phosphodiesterase class II)/transcriptional regulator with GAF, ATPase, and Fis domain
MVSRQPKGTQGQAPQTLAEQRHTQPLPVAHGVARMGLKAHLGLLGWLAMLVAVLLAGFWFVNMYLSNTTAFTQPWFDLFVALMLISGALCLQPDRIRPRFVNRNLISSIYLLLTFSSLYGAIIFSGRFAPYFAQLYILLIFIALYRFNRRAALLVCAGASLVYVLLTLPWPNVFEPNQLILSLAALWTSVAMYLLLYSRQQAAQRQLLEQVKSERHLRRQLETSSRLSTQLNANLNLDELLGEVVGAAAHLIDVPYCSLQICDYANNRLVMRNIYHSDPEQQRKLSEQWANPSLDLNQGLFGWVVQSGESISEERAADNPRYLDIEGLEEIGDWSLLLVPLTIKQRVIGVLGAGSPQRRHFSAEDRNLFSSFASQAVVAIENATMVNELIERKAQLERSQAGLAAVLDVNRTLLTQRDYIAAMHVIVDNLMPLIPFANCIIYLVEEDKGMLVNVLAKGADMANAENESFPIGEGITGLVAASGVAEMVNHAELDPRSAVIKGTDEDEPSSLLVAPLFVEGQVRGVIRVGRTGDWLFEPDELELLKIFATQASLALENANLIEKQSQVANDQSWMMSLTEILISALDIEEQLQQVVRASVSLTEADFGALLRRDEDGSLKVAAISAPQDYLKVGQVYVMDATPITEAFHSRRETYLPCSLKGEGIGGGKAAPPIAGRFRSQLVVPLVVGDELLGVLSVFSAQAAAFDRRFLRLLATFASQAAIAIRNSQLFAELETRRRELELKTAALEVSKARAQRNASEQAMLSHISKIAVNASGPTHRKAEESDWLTQSLRLVVRGLDVEKATLVMLNKSGQRELVAIEGFRPLGEDIVRRRVGDCELHQAVERGKFDQVEDCSTRGGMLGLIYAHEGVTNALAVPLQASDQIIGVLTVYNKKADERSANQASPNLDYAPNDATLPLILGSDRYRTSGNGSGSNGSRDASASVPLATTTTNPSSNGNVSRPAHVAFDTDNQILLRNMANAIASGIENARNYKSLSDTYFDSIRMLVDIMEAKDPYTKGHSEKVMVCAMAIGKELIKADHPQFKPEQMGSLLWAALLHDIGKLGIRDELLHLAARPGVEGFWVLASHTRIGAKILNNIEKLKQLAPLVQAHHERWDGQGYPDGLLRAEIPFISRIVTVADSFDAMTSDRDYQKKRSVEWAIEELQRNSGTQFDPEIVTVFLHILREQGDPREHAVPEIGPALAPDWVRI